MMLVRGLGLLTGVMLLWVAGCNRTPGTLGANNAWMRPHQLGPDYTTAIYLTLDNKTDQRIRLIGASMATAAAIEIHKSIQDNGVMRMQKVDTVVVAPGASFSLTPGGHHLMVKGLTTDLAAGDTISVALAFADHPPVETLVRVRWE